MLKPSNLPYYPHYLITMYWIWFKIWASPHKKGNLLIFVCVLMNVWNVMFVNKVNEMYSWKFSKIFRTYTAFKIQVLSLSTIKCWDKFRIFSLPRQCIDKKTAKDFINLCLSCCHGFDIPQHFAKDYDLVF